MTEAIRALSTGIEDKLQDMVKRANLLPQFLERNVKRKYLTAQKRRWMTENSSEYTSGGWAALSTRYAKEKESRFKDFDGHGRKTLIATNKLVKGILALSSDYRQVIGDRNMVISLTGEPSEYATYVDEKRNFTRFSDKFYEEIGDDLRAFVDARA